MGKVADNLKNAFAGECEIIDAIWHSLKGFGKTVFCRSLSCSELP